MPLFALTIFLSAALLFQVELIVGKELLPWFGGAPAVWTTCLLFFQIDLLAGYAYAHLLARRLRAATQVRIHSVLVVLSLIILLLLSLRWPSPITPGPEWKPVGVGNPLGRLLFLLVASVGLPFFVLSTTGPLLQYWFVTANRKRNPYPLYALSNAGSLVGLVCYPLMVEPLMTIAQQSAAWSMFYGVCAIGVVACAARLKNRAAPEVEVQIAPMPEDGRKRVATRVFLWIALSATATALLLSVTNHMCQDTAVIPLLWVLPLALYLATLMLAFEFDGLYRRWLFPPLFGLSVSAAVYLMFAGSRTPLMLQIGVDTALLFFGCMMCHGELARSRPGPPRLTLFYFCIAAGGALGGACVAVVAPVVFNGFWEYHGSLFAAAVVFLLALVSDRASFLYKKLPVIATALAIVVLALGGVLIDRILNSEDDVRFAARNFYGVLRVIEDNAEGEMQLLHGRITHGIQYEDSDRSRMPTSYYTENSGIGLAIEHHPFRGRGLRIGVIGLGVGTIAAYAGPSDTIRFYEINPAVLRLSTGTKPFFTYLRDCPGHADVVLGDARLMLEDELRNGNPQRFDVLAVDAFSSDAIPVHLMTREALEIYKKHLRMPYGVIAFHISNRYLNLVPVVHELARAAHLVSTLIAVERDDQGGFGSDWVLLSPSPAEFELQVIREAAKSWNSAGDKPVRIWTDDYSNLIAVLK